jgi:hypothetical protein
MTGSHTRRDYWGGSFPNKDAAILQSSLTHPMKFRIFVFISIFCFSSTNI